MSGGRGRGRGYRVRGQSRAEILREERARVAREEQMSAQINAPITKGRWLVGAGLAMIVIAFVLGNEGLGTALMVLGWPVLGFGIWTLATRPKASGFANHADTGRHTVPE